MNVKLSGNRDQFGLQRIPDFTGVGLEGFHCRCLQFNGHACYLKHTCQHQVRSITQVLHCYNENMSVESCSKVSSITNPHEEEISKASLTGRDLKTLKVVELQGWLQYKGASTKEKKTDLVLR